MDISNVHQETFFRHYNNCGIRFYRSRLWPVIRKGDREGLPKQLTVSGDHRNKLMGDSNLGPSEG